MTEYGGFCVGKRCGWEKKCVLSALSCVLVHARCFIELDSDDHVIMHIWHAYFLVDKKTSLYINKWIYTVFKWKSCFWQRTPKPRPTWMMIGYTLPKYLRSTLTSKKYKTFYFIIKIKEELTHPPFNKTNKLYVCMQPMNYDGF